MKIEDVVMNLAAGMIVLMLAGLAVFGVALAYYTLGSIFGGYATQGLVSGASCSSFVLSGCDISLTLLGGGRDNFGYVGAPVLPPGVKIGRYCVLSRNAWNLESVNCSDNLPSVYAQTLRVQMNGTEGS
jgi:hypothetical protein